MVLGWSAAACIGAAILIMIVLSAAAPEQVVPQMPLSAAGPPWRPLTLHLPVTSIYFGAWGAAIVGCVGVLAGLAAVACGARPQPWLLAGAAGAAVAAFTVLPPAGSSDTLDYAAYGRIAATGHSPYLMTPQQLRATGDPIGKATPVTWQSQVSVYGPLGTAEQWAAVEQGGNSVGRIVFWLKLWNAIAFCAVALAIDGLLRSDPVRRARAHLIWSVNPLLLWGLIAGGHIDGIATGLGFLGLTMVKPPRRERLAPWRSFAAGVLVGAATDMKITFGLFALGVGWTARRSPAALFAGAAGLAAAAVPAFAAVGPKAVTALLTKGSTATWDNLYQLFYGPFGSSWPDQPGVALVAGILFAMVAALALLRVPDRFPALPAIQPALAFSLAWLFVWPYQRPWYDAMVLCLLALYPASLLDWVVLVRMLAGTLVYLPGGVIRPGSHDPPWLFHLFQDNGLFAAPAVRLAALLALVALCVWAPRAWPTSVRGASTRAGRPGPMY